jgi:hypothetical protein
MNGFGGHPLSTRLQRDKQPAATGHNIDIVIFELLG